MLTALGVLVLFFYRSTASANLRRVEVLETEGRAIAERLRLDELATAGLQGQVAAQKAQVDALVRDHVPRAEWERAMASIQDQLSDLASRLDGRSSKRRRTT